MPSGPPLYTGVVPVQKRMPTSCSRQLHMPQPLEITNRKLVRKNGSRFTTGDMNYGQKSGALIIRFYHCRWHRNQDFRTGLLILLMSKRSTTPTIRRGLQKWVEIKWNS